MTDIVAAEGMELIREFALSYIQDFNVLFTAQRMGFSHQKARTWIKKPVVLDIIRVESRKVQQTFSTTLEETLNEIKRIAFFDHKDIIKNVSAKVEEGDFGIELHDFDDIDTRSVKNITISMFKSGPVIHVEPYNKMEALKELKDYFMKLNAPGEVHVHITAEDMAKKTAIQSAHDYQELVK